MDPWVSTQIRLAERQGLLHGPDLGPVQVRGVSLCALLDLVERSEDSQRSLKQAMLSTGRFDFSDLFPEYTSGEDSEAAIDRDLASGDAITYVFPAPGDPGFDPAEAEKLLAELLGDASSGQITAADLEGLQ